MRRDNVAAHDGVGNYDFTSSEQLSDWILNKRCKQIT